jgi:hypothetical protein
MLYLARVRFSKVGHRKAWFGNLTVDFTDKAGWPVETVPWLRNRGGKTTMLSLLFAVLAPAKPDFLGYHRKPGMSKKTLTDYVPADLTSHVVLEFTRRQQGLGPADPADRLLVGMACEWRGRRRSPGRDDNFEQLFYTLRPRAGVLTLDSLPFTVDGVGRLPLASYAEQLRAAHKADPQLAVATFRRNDSKADWVDHLEGLGIDPEAVRLQISMNRRESSAEEGFVFDSHGAFLDFILDLGLESADADAVSSLLVEHAADLRAEPHDRLELDFLTEAIRRLDALASAWEQVRAARTSFAALVDDAETLAAELRGGAAAAEQAALQAAERRDQAAQELKRITGQRRELAKKAGAARRRAAELTRAEAQRTLKQAAGRRQHAEADHQAWMAVPTLAEQVRRAAALATFEDEAAARQQQAEPLQQRCRAAAVALAGRLVTLRDADVDAADGSDRAAATHDEQAEAADADTKEAVAAAAKADAELKAIDQSTRRGEERVAAAVADGILPPGADAAAVLTRTARDLEQANLRAGELADELAALEQARPGLVATVGTADRRRSQAAIRTTKLATRAEQLAADAAAIAAEPRVCDVADELIEREGAGQGDTVAGHGRGDASRDANLDVWVSGPIVADRLDEAVAHADRDLVDLAVAAAEDQRAQAALVDTQLLPCRHSVATALSLLADGKDKIPAWSGWQYLADSVPAGRHADVIAAAPALVDGVIVLDSDDVDRARKKLTAAGLRPTAAIAVGAAHMLLSPDAGRGASAAAAAANGQAHGPVAVDGPQATLPAPGPDGGSTLAAMPASWFVVPPHQALYNPDAAEVTLAEIDERLEGQAAVAAALSEARDHDRKLADRIRGLLERCSPAAHAQLLADLADAEEELAAAETEHHAAAEALEAADRQAAARRREHAHLCGLIGELQRRADRLETLTSELAEVERQRARIPGLRADEADAKQLRTWAEGIARQRREEARQLREQAATQRAAAKRRNDEIDALHLDDATLATLTAVTPADAAQEPLEVLRERHATLQQAWRAAVTDEGLAERLERASRDLEVAQRAVSAIREPVRNRAHAMLGSPDGADEDRRALAASQALTANNHAQAAFAVAEQALTQAEDQAAALASEADADVLDEQPDTSAAANRYAVQLEAERAAAQQAETAASNDAEAAGRQADSDASRHQLLDTYAAALSSKLEDAAALLSRPRPAPGAVPAAPYTESPAAAKRAHEQSIGRLSEHMRTLGSLHNHAANLAEDLRAWAGGEAFEPLKATRARLQGVKVDDLAGAAAALRDDYRSSTNLLTLKLEQLCEHRRRIILALADVTSDALRLLDRVERASRLPKEGMGAWSKQPFVQLQFRRPASREQLAGQLSTLVDDLLHSPAGRSGTLPDLPDGATLVKRAVRVAIGGSFKAYLLEPDTFQVADRIPISKVSVLSGGQQLTVAIVLYCTLVEVRSAGRRRRAAGSRGTGGALLLDNPFGKVSDRSFFDLMHAVASKLGIQLIYTGHAPDEASLETFRRVVRLRNDGVDPAGRRHVEVRDTWLRDGDGISAAWIVVTPTNPAPQSPTP